MKMARLQIIDKSIRVCDPPAPDIQCRLVTGEELAFELVEICNSQNARFMASAGKVHSFIVAAYDALEPDLRASFDSRFINEPLSFSFREEATLASIRNVLPVLLRELAETPMTDEYEPFNPGVAAVVASVRKRGRLNNTGSVNFNVGGSFDPTVPLDAIATKLTKKYRTELPIELIAHFGGFAYEKDLTYREWLLKLFMELGIGPFCRVWVLESESIALVYPTTPLSA